MSRLRTICLVLAIILLIVVVIVQITEQRAPGNEWQSVNKQMANTL